MASEPDGGHDAATVSRIARWIVVGPMRGPPISLRQRRGWVHDEHRCSSRYALSKASTGGSRLPGAALSLHLTSGALLRSCPTRTG